MTALGYLKSELGNSAIAPFITEWRELPEDHKNWYKAEAHKDAAARGITLDPDPVAAPK